MAATESSTGERCARCGAAFHCGAHDSAPCPCTGVRLDAAVLASLRERYTGCLCLGCLLALSGSPPSPPPSGWRPPAPSAG